MLTNLLAVSLLVAAADPAPKSRAFRFTYEATVTGLADKEMARVWLPVPPTDGDQTVEIAEFDLPGISRLGREPKYGNRVLYVEAAAGPDGTLPLRLVYLVTRHEVRGESGKPSSDEADLFLKPDAKVPAEGKYLKLLDGKELPDDPLKVGRALFDLVNGELRYSKQGTGWGTGDANWVCDSKFGNCTDFHSLFIGLARSRKLPGRFEIGFALPPVHGKGEIAGYHCWAKFLVAGRGWVPVDVSMANQNPKLGDYCFGNLTADRVTFSVGRDITLVPKQDGPPLNFFVYPYAEVAGKPLPAEKVKRKFTFEDVK
jgi:hypothetical protein